MRNFPMAPGEKMGIKLDKIRRWSIVKNSQNWSARWLRFPNWRQIIMFHIFNIFGQIFMEN